MSKNERCVVTGAFSYTGKYISHRLLDKGHQVVTLTGHPQKIKEFDGRVEAFPYEFDKPQALIQHLKGASTLFNTYWVRFNRGAITYDSAVDNTIALFHAAKEAGIQRIIHVSITNPSLDSPFPYFRGKARIEEALKGLGLPYAILRPTVIFGKEDILINNIAYLLKRLPVFGIPGRGNYRLQPIFVEDMAELAVQSSEATQNLVIDAVGPDIFTFKELVQLIATSTGSSGRFIHLPPLLALLFANLISLWVGDVLFTSDELRGLMANLLISENPPTGSTRLHEWLTQNADWVGSRYASELNRHF